MAKSVDAFYSSHLAARSSQVQHTHARCSASFILLLPAKRCVLLRIARQEKHHIHKMYLCVYINIIYIYIHKWVWVICLEYVNMYTYWKNLCIMYSIHICWAQMFQIQIHQGLPIFPQFTRTNHRLEKFVRTSAGAFFAWTVLSKNWNLNEFEVKIA